MSEEAAGRPIHKILSADGRGKPDCVDVCEAVTRKLLKVFSRSELGIDADEMDHSQIIAALNNVSFVRRDANFMRTEHGDRILFCIVEGDAQEMAERILGRRLTEEELYRVKKGLEFGLEGWWASLEAAVQECAEGE
jgi:hypothetical protein